MENTIKMTKKTNTFILSHHNHHLHEYKNQSSAKQSLFELSQLDSPIAPPLNQTNIDIWNEKQISSEQESIKPLKYSRRSVPLRCSAEHRYLLQKTCQDYQNIEDSIIPKLKSILRKLQSPEKRKLQQKRILLGNIEENKKQNLLQQPKYTRKDQNFIMDNRYQRKNNSIRIKNGSSQKKSSKLFNYTFKDVPIRKIMNKDKCFNVRQFTDQIQIPLMRQARIKRTLKNILF